MHAERTTAQQSELLTQQQVAERFGIHRSTVSRWGRDGVIPVVSIGGLRRYRAADVQRLIDGAAS